VPAAFVRPTLPRRNGFRYFFFSREQPRMHVHVTGAAGEAKFWLEPEVGLAWQSGLRNDELVGMAAVIVENRDAFRTAWRQHFGG
jgi:hypothetical protein